MAVADDQTAPRSRPKLPTQPRQDRPRRRRPGSKLAPMLIAGLALAVAAFVVLRDQGASHQVAVAAEELRPGEAITAEAFEWTEASVGDEVLTSLVTFDEAEQVEGLVVANRVPAGELVSEGDLRSASAPSQLRAMSLPLEPDRAVAGQLSAGDRVDVAAVVDGQARYIATDLEVLDVTTGDQPGALGQTGRFAVIVAVDEDTGLQLTRALEVATVNVLRSTGAAEANAEPLEALDDAPSELESESEAQPGQTDEPAAP